MLSNLRSLAFATTLLPVLSACASPTLSLEEVVITVDARGIESGASADVVVLMLNEPAGLPSVWRDLEVGASSTELFDLTSLTDPAGRLRTSRGRVGVPDGERATRFASLSVRVAPRSREAHTFETYSDCLFLFVAVRASDRDEGVVYGPYPGAAFSRRTVGLVGRRGDFETPTVNP